MFEAQEANDADHLIGRVLEAGHNREVHLTIDVAELAQLVERQLGLAAEEA